MNVTTGADWYPLASVLTRALVTGAYTTAPGIVTKVVEMPDEKDGEKFPIAWHIPSTADIALNVHKIPGVQKRLKHLPGKDSDYAPRSLEHVAKRLGDELRDKSAYSRYGKVDKQDRAKCFIGGVLAHEAAHSMWSTYIMDEWYQTLARKERPVQQAIVLLEELRIEAKQVKRAAHFRALLRFSAEIVMPTDADMAECVIKDDDGKTVGVDLSRLVTPVALILGRRDAGVLNDYEVKEFASIVEDVFPTGMIDKMRGLWNEFIVLRDNDSEKMIDIGRRWVELMKEELGDSYGMDLPGLLDMLKDALGEALGEAKEWVASDGSHAPDEPAIPEEEASEIKSHGYSPGKDNGPWSSREANPKERMIAAEFARRLEKMSYRGRSEVKISSVVPPGRLHARSAVAQAADRSQGRATEAKPWRRTTRKHVDTPKLTVGVMTDVSGSMSWATGFVASSAWIINRAVRHINGTSASVVFGNIAEKILGPGDRHNLVVTHSANGGSEAFNQGCAALDGMLHLSDPRNGVRLLFVVSDGYLVAEGQMQACAKWVQRLQRSGCTVVWINDDDMKDSENDGLPTLPKGAHFAHCPEPRDLGKSFRIIADATERALRSTL